jgi:intraflagellar transport protein 56
MLVSIAKQQKHAKAHKHRGHGHRRGGSKAGGGAASDDESKGAGSGDVGSGGEGGADGSSAGGARGGAEEGPQLEDMIARRDWMGAIALLQFRTKTGLMKPEQSQPWIGYCAFHLGDYKLALETFQEMLRRPDADPVNHLHVACCLFNLGLYHEALEAVAKGPATRLATRLQFHCAQKLGDETNLMKFHQKLSDSLEDRLSLAAMHYLRGHFQDATEIYKRALTERRDLFALQTYTALCYYKLEYFDVAGDILAPYLEKFPDSLNAVNIKACNQFRLVDGKAAEAELKPVLEQLAASSQNFENDMLRHNQVVFRGGENALQVLPPLLDVIPEARLNLAIHHLRALEVGEAAKLMKDVEPSRPPEYILKAILAATQGQASHSAEQIRVAQQYFQLVGASQSEMDTIPGRQCMASFFFLLKQFEDVLVYLNSIQPYCGNDSAFNFDLGVAQAAAGHFEEAEKALLLVTAEHLLADYCYKSWLARCFIRNGKPKEAWELALRTESPQDSLNLLLLVANDCYRDGHFLYAAKAFSMLINVDGAREDLWDGLRGACCGTFQLVVAGQARQDDLHEVIELLSGLPSAPLVDRILHVMNAWMAEHGK